MVDFPVKKHRQKNFLTLFYENQVFLLWVSIKNQPGIGLVMEGNLVSDKLEGEGLDSKSPGVQDRIYLNHEMAGFMA